jgi:hypothetical protein
VEITIRPVEHLIAGFDLLKYLVADLALELVHPLHVVGGGVFLGLDLANPRSHLLSCLIGLRDECAAQEVCHLDCGESPSCFDVSINQGMDFLPVWV